MLSLLLTVALARDAGPTYVISSDKAETQAVVDAGIEASVQAFGLFFQPIVRRALAKVPDVCDAYAFEQTTEAVSWRCDRRKPVEVPAEAFGQTWTVRHQGKKVDAVVTPTEQGVVARFDAEDGWQELRFVLDAQSGELTVRTTIGSRKLSVPLTWSLTYRQEGEAP